MQKQNLATQISHHAEKNPFIFETHMKMKKKWKIKNRGKNEGKCTENKQDTKIFIQNLLPYPKTQPIPSTTTKQVLNKRFPKLEQIKKK